MYRILDRDSVPDYLRSLPAVNELLGEGAELRIDEIGDGNLNFVYRVTNAADASRSVILKQAVPYLRMVGEEWPLSRDRMTYEIRALKIYNDLVPDLVPTIHHADEEMSTLVMQNLDDHIILRIGMIDGIVYPDVGEHIGMFMAQTLFATSALGMTSEPRRALMDQFTMNAELCKLTEEFIFTFPYMTHDSNYVNPATEAWADEHLRTNTAYKLDVLRFKDLFLTKADALLHADLHTGSLMVNQTESYVIDMEFAYFGPFGFDVGKVISNFLLACTSHYHLAGGAEYRAWLLQQITVIWNTFSAQFLRLWEAAPDSAMLIDGLLTPDEEAQLRSDFMLELLHDAVGFAACSMTRRTLGIAGVADIRDIEDLETRSRLEVTNLKLSMELMAKHRQISSIDQLLETIRTFYAQHETDL
jgi:5-methylthioribose kinase